MITLRAREVSRREAVFGGWSPAVVMFDLDGTLVETMGAFADLAAELIHQHYGVEPRLARSRYLQTSGVPFREQLELIFPADPRNDEVAVTYEGRKPALCRDARMAPDTRAALDGLRGRGLGLVVSSNAAQRFVDEFHEAAGRCFDLALGNGDGLAKGLPHVALTCRHFGVEPGAILFVGDSLKDAELAHRCGQRFIGRAGTFRPAEFHRAFPGVPTIDRVSELEQVLPCR